jgi:hypothetical protein
MAGPHDNVDNDLSQTSWLEIARNARFPDKDTSSTEKSFIQKLCI